MTGLAMQAVAGIAVERVLNSLPAGLLIAFFTWTALRVLRRQNSGTRFAVWFVALLTIAGLPWIGGFGQYSLAAGAVSGTAVRAPIVLSGSWALYIFVAWFAVAFVAMARLAVGLRRLHGLRRSCIAIDAASLDAAVRRTVEEFSASRKVTIATSEAVRVPSALGLWKPMIVIPRWALLELPAEELKIILLHEYAHLRRRDDWTNLVQKTVRAMFFFHPALWWIENRLSVEREMACDDAVLAETGNARGYASCLISLLEKNLAHRGWVLAQAVVHRAHEASLRLAQILDADRPAATRVWKPALGLVGGFAIACFSLAPRTPGIVAIRQNTAAVAANVMNVTPRAAGRSVDLQSATMVPAAMRHESSARATNAKGNSARRIASASAAQSQVAEDMEEETPVAPRQARVVAAKAEGEQLATPTSQMLIFVQSRESVGPNVWVWRVQVWRVTVTSPTPDRVASGVAAHST